jgi:ABC-type transport system substrate-binding protein
MRSTKTAIVAAMLVFGGCAASPGVASADPPALQPEPTTTVDHDGTYAVGTDIVPGTYSSAGPVGNGTCYWKRLGGPNAGDIVDNAMSKQPQVVQIDPADTTFKTNGCQPWQITDAASPDGTTPGALPALVAQAQLRTYINTLNSNARQFDGTQLPQP